MLCGLLAATAARGSQRRPALALLFLSPLCMFASPYGIALAGYYRELLTNPLLPKFVAEWKASTPGVLTAVFYAVLLGGVVLLVKYGRKVALYDKLALALLAVSAVTALRSIIWFGLAAVIVLTPLVDHALGATRSLTGKTPARAGLAAGGVALVIAVIVFSSSSASLEQYWPRVAADRVALLASQHGNGQVFADGTYADWLLWARPELRNRIAYDARFELLRAGEFTTLSDYGKKKGEHWRDAATGYNVFVFDTGSGHCPGTCVIVYRDRYVTVATRYASERSSSLGAVRIAGLSVPHTASTRPTAAKRPIVARADAVLSKTPAMSGPSGAISNEIMLRTDSARPSSRSGVIAIR
jgi:hypothetical protein